MNNSEFHTGLKEKDIYWLFQASLVLKGLHAILEIAGGFLLYWFSTHSILNFVMNLTQDRLIEKPRDSLASHLLHLAQGLSVDAKTFASLYLLSHGIVKIFLVVTLLQKKLWAYPFALSVLSLFVVYQVYRFTHTHFWGLIVLSVFDLILMGLIWHEYKRIKNLHSSGLTRL